MSAVETKIYCYKFMWKSKTTDDNGNDCERFCFKIVTDTVAGLSAIEDALSADVSVVLLGKEYLYEIDCTKLGIFETLKGGDNNA